VTPEQIRREPIKRRHFNEAVFLREIAAQLCEANELTRTGQKQADEVFEYTRKTQARMMGDDEPLLAPLTIVKVMGNILPGAPAYWQICSLCARPHPVTDEEAAKIISEFEAKQTGRPH
jgi:hypothetical protein